MIESIRLANIATYGNAPETMTDLKEINFFYGANGAGKTSISRLINDPSISPTSQVTWRRNTPMQALVYNNEFIEKNFTSVVDLKGVFTLGEAEQSHIDKIAAAKVALTKLTALRDRHQETLIGTDGAGGKKAEITALEADLKEKCWARKREHDAVFQGAFTGLRNNSDNFKARVLTEHKSNTSDLVDIDVLKEKAKLLYGDAPELVSIIPPVTVNKLIELESAPILKKKVLGKSDVDIASMIEKLNNSDWVRQGVKYFKENEASCPFCQQKTSKNFERSLNEYFDQTFEADTNAVNTLQSSYNLNAESLNQQAARIIDLKSTFIDQEKLELQLELLNSIITINQQRIEGKKTEPSSSVELEPIEAITIDLAKVIETANNKIAEQNRIVASFTTEQKKLTNQIWKYLLVELKDALADYDKKRDSLTKATSALEVQIEKANTEIRDKDAEIKDLEKTTTSIQPTVTAINHLLKSFGFKGFSLAVASTGNSYKLVRADGTDAKNTLSEGEKTFVTFLYFYQLLKGSPTSSGMTTDRIVVIDDPVSSLDSDILFIVGSLIKKLFTEIKDNTGNLKQIFVLTHNVYFHKEITFNQDRRAVALRYESFWIVRKPGMHSTVERCPTNPIKTSYELLWSELKKPVIQNLTVQNTMRRILENYFKILGGIDLNNLYEHFEGEEMIHCKSLISWVNDGSHYSHDDLYVAIEEPMVASYTKIFFKIFKVTKQLPHYEMMMGDHYIDLDPENVAPEIVLTLPVEPEPTIALTAQTIENTQIALPSDPILSPAAPSITVPAEPIDEELPF
jgi:wobble nucleotide-excising tRNase